MPFSRLYSAIVNARNSFYERGFFKSHALGAPAISVGNITVGGTGKTPLVAFIAGILLKKDAKVCILTRGYGRKNPKERVLVSDGKTILADAENAGDEPFELAQKLNGKVFIIADANRVSAAKWAREKFGITAFLLDDAFQHQKARRDLNIVTIDATKPFGNKKVLPSGILREPLENLKRADLIVITRANLADNITDLRSQISQYNSVCPILVSENQISDIIELKDFLQNKQNTDDSTSSKIKDQRSKITFLAFCALGNPENFFEQIRREGFNLITTEKFPDHHFYKQKDIEKLLEKAFRNNAECLLTTAKDAVKLKDLKIDLPCYVVENSIVFEDEKKLREMIGAVFSRKNQS